jgi:hypothetical protein
MITATSKERRNTMTEVCVSMLVSQQYCSEINVKTGLSTDVIEFVTETITRCFKVVISNAH